MTSEKEVEIVVFPWLRDHAVNGEAVLPAVESLRLLACEAKGMRPELFTGVMEQALFRRFLRLPGHAPVIPVVVRCETDARGGVRAALCARTVFGATRRLLTHVEVIFPGAVPERYGIPCPMPCPPEQDGARILEASEVYERHIPFGPAFHSLRGRLLMGEDRAWGCVCAPDYPLAWKNTGLGSPFPLDGAMHGVCVHGQGQVDFTPFPVGFARRTVFRPTRPGQAYRFAAHLKARNDAELVYDLFLWSEDGELCEQIQGLRMRDAGVVNPARTIEEDAPR